MAKKKAEPGKRIRPTVSGFHLYAFELFRDSQGKTDSEAVALIMQVWLRHEDKELLDRLEISLEKYQAATGGNVRKGGFKVEQ